jgi:hypothetical protein
MHDRDERRADGFGGAAPLGPRRSAVSYGTAGRLTRRRTTIRVPLSVPRTAAMFAEPDAYATPHRETNVITAQRQGKSL